MSKFGPQPINDASKGVPTVTYQHEGEERIDRRPAGKVERFVDPQGNVVSIQLSPSGDPNPVATADRMRMSHRREGFVEHAKCPLKHGIRHSTPAIDRDYLDMPAALERPCVDDPQVMTAVMRGRHKTLHAQKSCPHIEWLITSRREREKAENDKRFAYRAQQETLEKSKLELAAIQLEEAKERQATRKAGRPRKVPEGE